MNIRSKQRLYGNRNKIVRVRNENFQAMVTMVSFRLNCSYQEAFEYVCNYLTSKEAFGVGMAEKVVDLFRLSGN